MVTEMTEAQREIKLYELKPDVYIYLPIVMFILVLISLLLRVYTRAILIKAFGLDDWLLLLAFVSLPLSLDIRWTNTDIHGSRYFTLATSQP